MNWFVAYSKSRSELKAMDYFEKTGINSYVPCYKEKREWSDRVKIVKVPAISGYVFFELNLQKYEPYCLLNNQTQIHYLYHK